MRTEELEAHVFAPSAPWLAARTLRALERLGVDARLADDAAIGRARGPVWLVRAGAVPARAPRVPPASATGRPLVALGAISGDPAWYELLARTGGDLESAVLPRVDSALVLRPEMLARRAGLVGLDEAVRELTSTGAVRAVRLAALDVVSDPRLRVIEAVTTLHRGGAERIVLDLVHELRGAGHDVLVAVLDRASRATFDAPAGTVHLHELAKSRAGRVDALSDLAIAHGADLVHVHLADGDEVRLLGRASVPVVVTVHNARQGWPARFEPITDADAALVVGCSCDVTRELSGARVTTAVRTIWNGIDSARATRSPRRARDAADAALVLLSVANHRPQKRLERVPGIVAALRARGVAARAVIVGEPVRADVASLSVAEAVRREAERHGVTSAIELAGSCEDVSPLYAQADVVVSTSAYEGLSLVHLEAIAAGVPLVTTAVSGTRELARKHEGVRLVPEDADAETYADAILEARRGSPGSRLADDFTTRAMTRRHLDLFGRVVASRPRAHGDRPRRGGGLLLVTNNFSTGGAQSSARRLLAALSASGIRVQAVVLEEQRDHPTIGRAALAREGVPVHVAPRAGQVDPSVTAADVVALVDRSEPDAVLFWNVIPEHKILMADMLLGVPVWDVSPGEMYYASFERYFARPRVGLPYLDLRDYGLTLAGAVVKYEGERARAEQALGTSVFVVPNGVVVPERPARRHAGRTVVVGTLARLSPDKKLEQLVDAARLRGFELRVAGAPERGSEAYADELRARAEGARVTFVGEQESAQFLAGIDLLAMVSEPAGCPNASLEAMAAGLAVVATDHGGARDQIEHGATGLLVPRGDALALGDAIASLVADEAQREAMGDRAHARAKERFSVARMAADYARICL